MTMKPTFLRVVVPMLLLLGLARPAPGQFLQSGFTPSVLLSTGPSQALFTATVSAGANRAVLFYRPGNPTTPTPIDLHDDGTAGDLTAGDNVWSCYVPTAPIFDGLTSADVATVFVGEVHFYNGGVPVFDGFVNAIAPVHTPLAGTWPVVQLAPGVQATSHVVNIVDPAAAPGQAHFNLLRRFYQLFGDDYDFVNVVFLTGGAHRNRTYFDVKNDVQGIGAAQHDSTALFGSAGRLQGVIEFPLAFFFDGANTGQVHEIGHRWVNYLSQAPLGQGAPHWPRSSMASGIMGFSLPGAVGAPYGCVISEQNGEVQLRARQGAMVFNDLDLYLMGLLAPGNMQTQIVPNDQAGFASVPCSGQYAGPVTRITAQDIINAVGPRVPSVGAAQTQFRIATILVTTAGPATPEEMSLFSWLASRAEARTPLPVHEGRVWETQMPFYVATGGRATLDARLGWPSGGGPVPGTPLVGSPTNLRLGYTHGNIFSLLWSLPRGGLAPTSYVLEGGLAPGSVLGSLPVSTSGQLPVPALPAGVYYLRMRAIAGAQTSPPSNEIPLFVNVPAPPATPTNLLGFVNGSALGLAWQYPPGYGVATRHVLEVSGTLSGSVPLSSNELFQFPSVPDGTYTFRVRGINAAGTSGPSPPVTLTFPGACSGPPGVPANFEAGVFNNISLTWDLPVAGPAPTGYVLSASGAVNGTLPLSARGISASVGPGSYTLSARAVNPCGEGPATSRLTLVIR